MDNIIYNRVSLNERANHMETRKMVYMALFTTMIFVATNIRIHLPLGTGGLVHIGTLMMFAIALKYGKTYGAVSAAIGMSLFDVLMGWGAWAPGTFFVRLIAGFLVGFIAHSNKSFGSSIIKNILAIIVGGVVIVSGYYIFESIFITNFHGALLSIPGNLMQIAIGVFAIFILDSLPKLQFENYTHSSI